MNETSVEMGVSLSQEKATNVLSLSREIKPLIDSKSEAQREQTRVFLKNIYPEANYDDFGQILDLRNANIGDSAKERVNEVVRMVGAAYLIAGGDKIYQWVTDGTTGIHIAEGMERISEVVDSNLLVRDEKDEVGKFIVKNLIDVEKINVRAAKAPGTFEEKRVEETKKIIGTLFDRLDEVDYESEDADKLSAVIGCLDSQIYKVEDNGRNNRNGGRQRKTYVTYTPGEPDDEGNPGRGESGFSYGPEFEDFATAVIRGVKTDFRRNSPPRWFKESSDSEKLWYEMADYLSECSENKTALKDNVKGVEKLWLDDNYRAKVHEAELKLMYENEGFRFAMEKIIQDLCVLNQDNSSGSKFLYLKQNLDDKVKKPDGKGFEMKVKVMLGDVDNYKKKMALSVCINKAYLGSNDSNGLFLQEISKTMSSVGLSKENAEEKWKEQHNFKRAQIEVGTAWNFLYNCDFIESADFLRKLGPIDGVRGDAVNFIFHPEAKVSSKLTEEKLSVGQDEIKGGPLADWYDYQLTHDEDFRAEYKISDGDSRLFPERLGVGFLDTFTVKTMKRREMSMAQALMEGKTIDFSKKTATKKDVFKDYKDMREGSLIVFKFLTGLMPLGKSTPNWSIEAQNALSLLRQQGTMPDKNKLPILDDKRLYAAIIYSSAGVNKTDKLLSLQYPTPDYKETVRQLCLNSFIRSTNPDLNEVRAFSQFTVFQKEVFDFIYKGSAVRGVYNIFSK